MCVHFQFQPDLPDFFDYASRPPPEPTQAQAQAQITSGAGGCKRSPILQRSHQLFG